MVYVAGEYKIPQFFYFGGLNFCWVGITKNRVKKSNNFKLKSGQGLTFLIGRSKFTAELLAKFALGKGVEKRWLLKMSVVIP